MSEKKQFAFIVMPFDESFDDVYKLGIRAACEESYVTCQRVDEQIFQEIILERIANQIRSADFLIADVTGRNANVFFEIGFALALKKKVILIARKAEDIPFDLKPFPHLVYGSSISNLKAELIRRIPEFLARKDGYTIGQEVVTAPRPDVRIQVQNGLVGHSLSTPILCIQAQNHSPMEVYLANFFLSPRKGGTTLVMQDGATGRFQGRVVLKPGEGHTFHILASALFQDYAPGDYVVAGVRDEIGREYTSTEEELASALRTVFRSFTAERRTDLSTTEGGPDMPTIRDRDLSLDIDSIVEKLAHRRQRASYGAVAGILNALPRVLMAGRPKSPKDSWVVSKNNSDSGSRQGWPTGYSDSEIDPACLEQCQRDPRGFIADAHELRGWLDMKT